MLEHLIKKEKETKESILPLKTIQTNIIIPCDLSNVSQIDIKFTGVSIINSKNTNELEELLRNLINLVDLKLILGQNSIDPQGMIPINEAVKNLTQLKSLFFKVGLKNAIGSAGFSGLSKSIHHLTQLTNLSLFIEPQNSLKSDGIKELANVISSLTLLQIFTLKIDDNKAYLTDGIHQLLVNLNNCKELQNLTIISLIDKDTRDYQESQKYLRCQCLKEMYKITPLLTKGVLQLGSSQMIFNNTNKGSLIVRNFRDYSEQYSQNEIDSFRDIGELTCYCMENCFEFIKNIIKNPLKLQFFYSNQFLSMEKITLYLSQISNLTYLNFTLHQERNQDTVHFLNAVMQCKNLKILNLTGSIESLRFPTLDKIVQEQLTLSFKNISYMKICFSEKFGDDLKYKKFKILNKKKFLKQRKLVHYNLNHI